MPKITVQREERHFRDDKNMQTTVNQSATGISSYVSFRKAGATSSGTLLLDYDQLDELLEAVLWAKEVVNGLDAKTD